MSVYASNKAMFEQVFDKAAEAIVKGRTERYLELRETLLECYNNAMDSLEHQFKERVKLAQLEPPKTLIICANCAKEIK